jgi:hypothetical protein
MIDGKKILENMAIEGSIAQFPLVRGDYAPAAFETSPRRVRDIPSNANRSSWAVSGFTAEIIVRLGLFCPRFSQLYRAWRGTSSGARPEFR